MVFGNARRSVPPDLSHHHVSIHHHREIYICVRIRPAEPATRRAPAPPPPLTSPRLHFSKQHKVSSISARCGNEEVNYRGKSNKNPRQEAKLEKFAYWHPELGFSILDVNTMPQAIVRRANVTQMPTLQIYRDGEIVGEIVGAEDSDRVIAALRKRVEELQKA